jgi:hypothetical protein
LEFVDKFRALLLESLAERVIVLEADTVLFHQIVIGKLG